MYGSRYGDRSPQSIQARLFAVLWILTGLILTSILMGGITNALTTVTFASTSIKLYGTKVGILFTTCTILSTIYTI